MVACRSCGAGLDDEARFCSACGVPTARSCPRCDATVAADARFCSQCGTTLDVEPVAPSSPGPEVKAGAGAAGERKVVTVLFADITGSTGLSERLDPEQMRSVLRVYFEAMRAEIEVAGGTVEKFIGDAVMAVFGVPTAHEDDAARALRAALGMMSRLSEVNDTLERDEGVRLAMRIGVNTGEVLAETRLPHGEGMVTGDMVNVAARLQSLADPGQVLASERTARAARGFAYGDPVDAPIRGRTAGIRALPVHAETGGGDDRGVPGVRAPLVGRDREVALLDTVLDRAVAERSPTLVTVFGDAGVGKSRLTREFLSEPTRADRVRVLRGRCLPYGSGVAYWPLAEIIKAHAQVSDSDTRELALSRIQASVRALFPESESARAGQVADLLAYTAGIDPAAGSLARLESGSLKGRLQEAWPVFFSAVSSAEPVVVVIEDIHWADPSLLDIVETVVDQADGPLVVICTSRPDLVSTRQGWGGGRRNATVIDLAPLDTDSAARMMEALVVASTLPTHVRARILERSEGNPLFLEEILRQLIDAGIMTLREGRWAADESIDDVVIPDSVQAVLAARIDMLDTQDRVVLRSASVVGRAFWPGAVAVVAGNLPLEDVNASLHRLGARDLVLSRHASTMSGQREYLFTHILTRDVAYESIPLSERVPAHAAVAGWIEAEAGGRSEEFAELIAQHLARAVEIAREAGRPVPPAQAQAAYRWLMTAANGALHRAAPRTAALLASRAEPLAADDVERVDALEVLANGYHDDSRGTLAWHTYLEAARTAETIPHMDPERTAMLYARACQVPLRWRGMMQEIPSDEEVRTIHQHAVSLAPPGDSIARAHLLGQYASYPWAFGWTDPSRALGYAQPASEAIEIALRLGDYDLASSSLDTLSSCLSVDGNYSAVIPLVERRLDLRQHLTSEMEIADVHAMAAWTYCEVGRYADAIRIADDAPPLSYLMGVAHIQSWKGWAQFLLGRWDEAVATWTAGIALLAGRAGDPPGFTRPMFVNLALIHAMRGEDVRDLAFARIIAAIEAEPATSPEHLAWLNLARGRPDEALRLIELSSSLADGATIGGEEWRLRCQVAWWDGISEDQAWSTAEAARSEGLRMGAPLTVAAADALTGITDWRGGRADRACEVLQQARQGFAALGADYEEARINLVLARLAEATGGSDEAAERAGNEVYRRLRIAHDATLDLLPG